MTPSKLAKASFVLAVALGAAACAADTTPPASCSTGKGWNEGTSENPLMVPGGDCIGCHRTSHDDDAPPFEVAGTVMGSSHDDDDCDGIEGVIVRITGADKVVVELMSNPAGNFYRTIGEGPPIAKPFSVELEKDGKIRKMLQTRSTGDCASCHTVTGANEAPGRILAP